LCRETYLSTSTILPVMSYSQTPISDIDLQIKSRGQWCATSKAIGVQAISCLTHIGLNELNSPNLLQQF